jgi:hypothetical protein
MAVTMGMPLEMNMLMRMCMRMNMGEFMVEKTRGKTGIEKPIMLMTLLTGLFRSVLFIMQVIDGILSGHFISPHFDSVLILNLEMALYIGIYL